MKENIRILFMCTVPMGVICIFWYFVWLFLKSLDEEILFRDLSIFLNGGAVVYFLIHLYSTK